jgi:preprotein translocase subunit YajC
MNQLLLVFAQETTEKPSAGPFGDPSILLLMAGIFMAFYFLVIMPMKRREKRDREDLFGKLKKNDEVLTASGIIGVIAQVKDDEVILKVDESSNTRLRVLKSTIVQIRNPKEAPKEGAAKTGETAATENVKAGAPPAGK